jgi:rod shape determining protein RodA
MVFGLIALYSASFHNVRVSQQVFWDQLICAVIGLGIMFYLSRVDYRKFFDLAYVLYGISLVLLFLVFVFGRHALGARRWIEIGFLSFQPSEFTKLATILMLGRYYSVRKPKLVFNAYSSTQALFQNLLFPFFLVILPMLMVFQQPDLGTSLLLLGIFIIMVFASELEYSRFLSFIALGLAVFPFLWHILKPYQKERLLVFLNPNIDPLGSGYTIIQSKIAVGSGQLFGKGWLAGTQNQLNFLPERHTDFIFSVVGEEWGLLGSLFLVYCYFGLINCGLKIADQINDKFGLLVTTGIVGILTLQVAINIGMVIGLCPVVGLTLPFVSYGRTSFMIYAIMMGFLLNLSKKRTVF